MGQSNPDVNLEVGYDLKTQKATFSVGVSNVFNRIGKKTFGMSASKWWTRRKAKGDAKQGLPLTSATVPDGREEEINNQRQQQLTKIEQAVNHDIQNATDWITTHSPNTRLSAETLTKEVNASISERLSKFRRRLQETRDEFRDSINEYSTFREDHGLKRHADVPLFFLKPFVILMSLLLLETIANSFIFAGISAQGLIGGWVTAVMVSVINILMGLVFGLLIIRYARILDKPWKHVLIGLGCLLVSAAVFFNLYVAHFREVAEAALIADQAGEVTLTRAAAPHFADAWPHFLQNPFNLGSVLGIALFVIGLVIFGVATYEGYKGFTDPYPGYGKVGKRFLILRIIRITNEDDAREAGFDVLRAARQRLNVASAVHSHFKDQISVATSFSDRLSKAAETAEKRVNNHAWSLISTYRSANKRKRLKLKRKAERKPDKGRLNPGDVPEYFDRDPRTLPDWQSVVPDADELARSAVEARTIIDHNMAVLDEVKQYVSHLQTEVDRWLEDALDQDDTSLNSVAVRMTEKPAATSKFKVVENAATA